MRIAVVALLGACTFTPGEPKGPGGDPPPGRDPGVDAAIVMQRPACDLTDSSVKLCLDFDATPLGLDSAIDPHDASISNVSRTPRAPEMAIKVDINSDIHVTETTALDLTDQITYEAWIAPAYKPPPYGSYYAVANLGQYGLSVQPDGKVRCELAGIHADSHDPIAFGTWTHVACTYDRRHLDVYTNGVATTCTPGTAAIATTGQGGTEIGAPFIGAVDNVHILSRAATGSEICAHAGRSGCEPGCD